MGLGEAVMSEYWVYVACTCFRDHVTSQPPVPRGLLTYDRFGNVTMRSSRTPDSDPETLWDWRERACPHDDMRLLEDIWWSSTWDSDPVMARIHTPSDFPNLHHILERGRHFGDAEILATPAEADSGLAEFIELDTIPLDGRLPVVVDLDARPVIRLPRHRQLTGQMDEELDPDEMAAAHALLQVHVEGNEFVITDHNRSRELMRASVLEQLVGLDGNAGSMLEVSREDCVEIVHHLYPPVVLRDPLSGEEVEGYGEPITNWGRSHLGEVERHGRFPAEVRITYDQLRLTDLSFQVGTLRPFLEASVLTGNPMVGYYSGSSVGFDE